MARSQQPEDTGEKPDSEGVAAPRVWYGGPLIATYSVTAIVGTVTFSSGSNGSLLFLTVFSSPTIHWANRKVGKGFLSLLMQPVAAGAGALLAADSRKNATIVTAALVGYAAWAVVDIAVIAYKDAPARKPPESASLGVGVFRVRNGGGAEVFGVW